jgi:hypothetical protein
LIKQGQLKEKNKKINNEELEDFEEFTEYYG